MERLTTNALTTCGRSIRLDLKRIYGTPEDAEDAIRKAMEDEEALEMWATIVTAKSNRIEGLGDVADGGDAFTLKGFHGEMRESAKACLAAAMLVWTARQEGRL